VTHTQLKELLEAQIAAAQEAAQAKCGSAPARATAKKRAAVFARLAATSNNVSRGQLAELDELKQMVPVTFARVLSEVGISITPRHALEFVAIAVNRMRAQGSSSGMYAPKAYREVLRR
jgi:hypothetical protein